MISSLLAKLVTKELYLWDHQHNTNTIWRKYKYKCKYTYMFFLSNFFSVILVQFYKCWVEQTCLLKIWIYVQSLHIYGEYTWAKTQQYANTKNYYETTAFLGISLKGWFCLCHDDDDDDNDLMKQYQWQRTNHKNILANNSFFFVRQISGPDVWHTTNMMAISAFLVPDPEAFM